MKRSLLAVAVSIAVLFLGAGAQMASAQGDPYATTSLVTTPTVSVVRGAHLWVTGGGCAPHVPVTLRFDDGTPLGGTRSDALGRFRKLIVIPLHANLGDHTITGTCAAPSAGRAATSKTGETTSASGASGTPSPAAEAAMIASPPVNGQVTQSLRVSVVSGGAGSGLARTGSSATLPLLAVAAAVVTLGGAFLIGSRRAGDA